MRRPILVTGSHRSGTTWAGHLLTLSGEAFSVHEPLNPGYYRTWLTRPAAHWFQHVDQYNAEAFSSDFDAVVGLRPPLTAMLRRSRTPKEAAMAVREFASAGIARTRGRRALLKDPIAFFSAEWLSRRYECSVLVLIRHPGAFASSLKRLDWRFDFRNFTRQPRLMETHLADFADAIRDAARREMDIIDQAILLWRIFALTSLRYREQHRTWLVHRYEDLALEPLQRFPELYRAFGLTWSSGAAAGVEQLCSSLNPGEAPSGHRGGVARDSVAATRTWRHRLTDEDVARVRAGTEDAAAPLYGETAWE